MRRSALLIPLLVGCNPDASPVVDDPLALSGHDGAPAVVIPSDATLPVVLAAKEVRRYTYQRTGTLLSLTSADALPPGDVVLVAPETSLLVEPFGGSLGGLLAPGGFAIVSVPSDDRSVLVIAGQDPDATLHAAYRYAEHLGVGFGLEGDILPDEPVTLDLDGFDERAEPVLETRGLLPFHNFPQGPDFWSTDDYLLVVGQLPKLGLNFIGLHTYPHWSTTEEAGL